MFSITGIAFVTASILWLVWTFLFNDKFRAQMGRTANSLKYFFIVPTLFVGLSLMMFGKDNTVGTVLPMTLQFALQALMMMSMMILQWGAMMWMMSRPKIDWYMPGQTSDTLTWDDYVGMDDVRDRMKTLVDFIQNPQKYTSKGAKLPKGVLFLGPPGVGKTYLARIVACTVGVPIAICESTSMQSPFMAIGALMVKALYRKLRNLSLEYGAAIVFFDEIDAIGKSRSGAPGTMGVGMGGFMGGGAGGGILNALLGCMDGINDSEPWYIKTLRRFNLLSKKYVTRTPYVITMGATNAPIESLDSALVRDGRFDMKLHVGVAGDEGRRKQILYFIQKRRRPIEVTDIIIDRLVQDFSGLTPIEIDTTMNGAVINAVSAGRQVVTYRDLWDALIDKMYGAKEPITLLAEEQERVAYHEAGHGVCDVLLPMSGLKCSAATIVPRGKALGFVASRAFEERHTRTKEDITRRILTCLASRAVELQVLGIEMNGFTGDLNQATNMAVQMVASYGMGSRMISYAALGQFGAPNVTHEAELILRAHFKLVQQIIAENIEAVHALAKTLIKDQEIDGTEVERIVRQSAAVQSYGRLHERAFAIYEELDAAAKADGHDEKSAEFVGPALAAA